MSLGYFEGQNVFTRAFEVDSTVTALKRGTFVDLGAGGIVQAAAAGKAVGVVLEDYDTSGASPYVWPNRKGVSVRLMGTALVEAGGAIAAGAEVEVGVNGTAVAKVTGVAVGIALNAATAAGDMIEVLLK